MLISYIPKKDAYNVTPNSHMIEKSKSYREKM